MGISINNLTKELFIKKGFSSLFEQVIIAEKNKNDFDITITIVGSTRIRKLNNKYLQENVPTDILSFNEPNDLWPINNKNNLLGELIICPLIIKKNAKKYGVTYQEELKRIVIHGILHLLGYSHARSMNDSREEIYNRQERHLKSASRVKLIK